MVHLRTAIDVLQSSIKPNTHAYRAGPVQYWMVTFTLSGLASQRNQNDKYTWIMHDPLFIGSVFNFLSN